MSDVKVKVHELAKELDMNSGELVEKIKSMGYDVTNHMSNLSEIEAKAIRNTILHSQKRAETKIVKVAPKETEKKADTDKEVRVVKQAAVAARNTQERPGGPVKTKAAAVASAGGAAPARTGARTPERPAIPPQTGIRPPEGVPMPKRVSQQEETVSAKTGIRPPEGVPMPKAAPGAKPPEGVPQPKATAKPPEGVPQPKATAKPPEGVPQPKAVAKPPEGVPQPKAAVKPPEGVPQPKAAVKPPEGVPQPKAAVKPPEGVPQPKAAQSDKPAEENGAKTAGASAEMPAGTPAPQKETPAAENKMAVEVQKPELAEEAAKEQAVAVEKASEIKKETPVEKKAEPEKPAAVATKKDSPQGTAAPKRPESERKPEAGKREDFRQQKPSGGERTGQGSRPSGRPDNRRPSERTDGPARPQGAQPPRKPKPMADAPLPVVEQKGRKSDKAPEKKGKFADKGEKDRRDGKGKFQPEGRRPMSKPVAPKKPHKTKAERIAEREAANESRINMEELPEGSRVVNVPITVAGLAEQIDRTSSEIIMALMKMGIMANINQNIDEDTAVLLGDELGLNIVVDKVEEAVVEEGLETFDDKEADLKSRPPIITVMGHVDHGKTSLLDAIRKTNITAGEAGGITQHIGASEVTINGQKIVFLDTPGHEAFTAMRARGAHITDIAVLVVAADDSVKPQTVESISHAKAAGVPVIVAINKMDKPGANPEKVKQDLTEHGILVEEWGGDVICVPVSAKSGEGIKSLLEMILLQAEMLELRANPNRMAMGSIIEAKLDKARGPVATLLVLNGTLKPGMSVVAGTCYGKVRAMNNSKGEAIRKAGPATAVEILGLTDVPQAGDEFNAVKEAADAKEIAEHRRMKLREEVLAKNASTTLEQLFSQIKEGEVKELNLIVKADVQGSVGALTQSLEKLHNENVRVKIIHSGVGTITETDVTLANTVGAVIIGFNVRPSSMVTVMAEEKDVEIRTYRVIYEIINDIEAAMKGMLDPIFKEVIMGKVEIRNTFKVPGVGIIGGAYVTEGKVQRNAEIRLVRDGIVIHEGKISSLKRFKDDAKEVLTGFECGIGIEKYNDIKEGDIIEAFRMEEVERK